MFTGGGTINYTDNYASSARNSGFSSLSDFNDILLPHDINHLCNPMIVSSLADVDQIDSRPAVVDERNGESSDSVMIDSEFKSVAIDYFKQGETWLYIYIYNSENYYNWQCIGIGFRRDERKRQLLLQRDNMCVKFNVSLVELVEVYRYKLRKEFNEIYCEARGFSPSRVALLKIENKGKKDKMNWTEDFKKYKRIYRSAKSNVRKFETTAFPGEVFEPRGGKRTTAEVDNNNLQNSRRGRRLSNNQPTTKNSRIGGSLSNNQPTTQFSKVPLKISFKRHSSPTLSRPVTTLDHAILNEIIKYFDLKQDQYAEILDKVKEHYPEMIMRNEVDEADKDDDDDNEEKTEDDDEDEEDEDDDDDENIFPKRQDSIREGIVGKNLTSVRQSKSCPVDNEEENRTKYR